MIQPRMSLPRHPFRRSRVLCVDDETMIRELVAHVLENQLGCEVVTAKNGAEALAAVRELEFEAVVADYLMPKMDGGEFFRRLEIERPDLAPSFLFMTGDVLSERTLDDIEASGCRVLVKPFGLPELTNAVSDILRASARPEDASGSPQNILGARVAS